MQDTIEGILALFAGDNLSSSTSLALADSLSGGCLHGLPAAGEAAVQHWLQSKRLPEHNAALRLALECCATVKLQQSILQRHDILVHYLRTWNTTTHLSRRTWQVMADRALDRAMQDAKFKAVLDHERHRMPEVYTEYSDFELFAYLHGSLFSDDSKEDIGCRANGATDHVTDDPSDVYLAEEHDEAPQWIEATVSPDFGADGYSDAESIVVIEPPSGELVAGGTDAEYVQVQTTATASDAAQQLLTSPGAEQDHAPAHVHQRDEAATPSDVVHHQADHNHSNHYLNELEDSAVTFRERVRGHPNRTTMGDHEATGATSAAGEEQVQVQVEVAGATATSGEEQVQVQVEVAGATATSGEEQGQVQAEVTGATAASGEEQGMVQVTATANDAGQQQTTPPGAEHTRTPTQIRQQQPPCLLALVNRARTERLRQVRIPVDADAQGDVAVSTLAATLRKTLFGGGQVNTHTMTIALPMSGSPLVLGATQYAEIYFSIEGGRTVDAGGPGRQACCELARQLVDLLCDDGTFLRLPQLNRVSSPWRPEDGMSLGYLVGLGLAQYQVNPLSGLATACAPAVLKALAYAYDGSSSGNFFAQNVHHLRPLQVLNCIDPWFSPIAAEIANAHTVEEAGEIFEQQVGSRFCDLQAVEAHHPLGIWRVITEGDGNKATADNGYAVRLGALSNLRAHTEAEADRYPTMAADGGGRMFLDALATLLVYNRVFESMAGGIIASGFANIAKEVLDRYECDEANTLVASLIKMLVDGSPLTVDYVRSVLRLRPAVQDRDSHGAAMQRRRFAQLQEVVGLLTSTQLAAFMRAVTG